MTALSGRLRSTLDERWIVSRQSDKVVPNQTIAVVPNQTIVLITQAGPSTGALEALWRTHDEGIAASHVQKWLEAKR